MEERCSSTLYRDETADGWAVLRGDSKGAVMNRYIQSLVLLTCVVVLFSSTGCQSAAVLRDEGGPGSYAPDASQQQLEKIPLKGSAGGYFKARLYDFADMFGISFLFGFGVDVNARATQFFQVGGGVYDARRLGFIGRFPGWWRESRSEGGISLAYGQRLNRTEIEGPVQKYFPNGFYKRPETMNLDSKDRTADEIGATAFAACIGADVFFRPVEFFDWFLGWFTLDFKQDDFDLLLKSTGSAPTK
jgi:hypothetical protein